MKPNCYKCKWRGEVVGSAHSSCKHPKCEQSKSNIMELFAILPGGQIPQIKTELNVKGNERGIRNGWFMHPFNFDPVWLEECDGFEDNNKEQSASQSAE